MLRFLINDILDYAHLQQGKFRKHNTCFDLKKAVDEVLDIQQYKAEQMGIILKKSFENFDALTTTRDNFKICTDQDRIK